MAIVIGQWQGSFESHESIGYPVVLPFRSLRQVKFETS